MIDSESIFMLKDAVIGSSSERIGQDSMTLGMSEHDR